MFNLDLLGQIYLVSSLVGGAFILFNVLLGQIGHTGSQSHGAHHLGADDHALADHSVHAVHHTGHSIADHLGHIHHAGHIHPIHSQLSHLNAPEQVQVWLHDFISGSIAERLSKRLLFFFQSEDLPAAIGMFLISWLNPMRIAILLTFFGLVGLLISRLFPFLSFLSLIPAILAGIIVANLFSASIHWLMDHIESSGVHNQEDLIGIAASVSIPILANKIGQIVYVADASRCQCSAKSATAGLDIERGEKVTIVGMEDHIALVEPIRDPILLGESNP